MKEIPLTQGKVALVDDVDYEFISQFKWFAQRVKNTWYAVRRAPRDEKGKRKAIYMHNFLMGGRAHHINGNGLDNGRSNLRLATNTQNAQAFRMKPLGCTSKYRGVYWHSSAQKWHAQIKSNGKVTYLGLFSSEEEAARIRDIVALNFFGEHAQLNFPRK